MRQFENLLYCIGLVLFFRFIDSSPAEDVRIWTHANGNSIAGTFKEFRNNKVVIVFGDREVRVKTDDLSPKDRAYLLEIRNQSKDIPSESRAQPANDEDARKTKEDKKTNFNAKADAFKIKLPEKMLDFVNLVNSFSNKYREAKNELQKSALRTDRQEKLKNMAGDRGVQEWIGFIAEMRTDQNRNAVIRVLLDVSGANAPDTGISAISITNNKVPIKHGSELYKRLATFDKSDVVIFSGEFLESTEDHILENSLTEWESMTEPEFEIRFSDITKSN